MSINLTDNNLKDCFGYFLDDLGKEGATTTLKKKTGSTDIIDTLKKSFRALSENKETDVGTLLQLKNSLMNIKEKEEKLNGTDSFLYKRSKWIQWFVVLVDGKNHKAKVKQARQLLSDMVEKTNEKVRGLTLEMIRQRREAIDKEQNKKKLEAAAAQAPQQVKNVTIKQRHFIVRGFSSITKFFTTFWSGSKEKEQTTLAPQPPPKNLEQLQKVINRSSLVEIQKVATDGFARIDWHSRPGSQLNHKTELRCFAFLHADVLSDDLRTDDFDMRLPVADYFISLIDRIKNPHTAKLLPLLKQFRNLLISINEANALYSSFNKNRTPKINDTKESITEECYDSIDKNKNFIMALGKGETCFIPISLQFEDDAHAIGCIIRREENGYNIKLANSGYGLHLHPIRLVGDKFKSLPYLEFTTSGPFNEEAFKVFRSIQRCDSIDKFYQKFNTLFTKVPSDNSQLKDDDFVTSQRGGTCLLRRINQMIRATIGREAYKELMAQIKDLSLNDTIDYAAWKNRPPATYRDENELLEGLILYAEEERIKRLKKRQKPKTL